MKLRFKETEILKYAEMGQRSVLGKNLLSLKGPVLSKGFLSKAELMIVAKWKAPRSAGHVKKNPDGYVEEITAFAFKTKNERSRIETLTVLDGVSWPTASVVLHFFHRDQYPILDFRALWSASVNVPTQYSFSFWWPYVAFCRDIANRNNVDMRTLDRPMWKYSEKNQRKS